MVKQWLNEYSSGVSGNSRSVSQMRQYRLNHLRTWHVEDVVNTIPVLLQLALAFFLSGLLVLLWNLHDTVAAVASMLVSLLGVFIATMTFLPLFHHQCSYRTPQIRAIDSLWQPKLFAYWVYASIPRGLHAVASLPGRLSTICRRLYTHMPSVRHSLCGVPRAIVEGLEKMIPPPDDWRDRKQTWRAQERSDIDSLASRLDTQTLVEAYSTTLHPDALSAASVCLVDYDSEYVIDYFRQLHKAAREHFGATADSWDGPLGYESPQQLLWLHIILCIFRTDDSSLSDDEAAALGVYFACGSWPSDMQTDVAIWAVSTCNAISEFLETSMASSKMKLVDQDQLREEKEYLIDNAVRVSSKVLLPDVTRTYRGVRLEQLRLREASSDDTKDAYTRYLKSVDHFLKCSNDTLTSSIPPNDMETVRRYTRDVLADLTRTLLGLFAEDKVQHIRAIIDASYLWDILRTLAFSSNGVLQCISDNLCADVLRMTEVLAKPHDYDDDEFWGSGILDFARKLKLKVICIMGEPDA
ncbi:hypothetical protein TRAPUB_12448, partial [Trametes pubescens]